MIGSEIHSPEIRRYYIQIDPETNQHSIHIEGCPEIIEGSFSTLKSSFSTR